VTRKSDAGSIPAASTINLLNNKEFAQQQTVLNCGQPRSLWHDLGTLVECRPFPVAPSFVATNMNEAPYSHRQGKTTKGAPT
jgi:hypothetical protein